MRTPTGLLIFALLSPSAFADVTLNYDNGWEEDAVPQYSLFIKGSLMRIETHDGENAAVVMFDADKREMTIIDPSRREYMKFDQATLARLQEQMKQALAMAAQYGMSPEQLGLSGAAKEPTVTVTTGEKKKVRGYNCTVERYEIGDEIDGVACIATAKEVGLSDADWKTMERMFEMLTDMANNMMPGGLGGLDVAAPNGIAIEASDKDGSNLQMLTNIDHGTIDGSKFAIPSGYKRMELPSIGG
ncbi:MAG: DUF4412 domain-containing protein [Gammaproteobacteria bacterium]